MTTKKTYTISVETYDFLKDVILCPSAPKQDKSHDLLVWDEAKRYILDCINHHIQVQY